MRDSVPFGITDERLFFRIVRASFSQRRKTLANGLLAALPLDKSVIVSILTSCGFRPDIRGETLSIESFAKLTDAAAEKLG
jgi:16S rRNA (adenine1518-N6/adenine1519-N6)-dimethyltransferase